MSPPTPPPAPCKAHSTLPCISHQALPRLHERRSDCSGTAAIEPRGRSSAARCPAPHARTRKRQGKYTVALSGQRRETCGKFALRARKSVLSANGADGRMANNCRLDDDCEIYLKAPCRKHLLVIVIRATDRDRPATD